MLVYHLEGKHSLITLITLPAHLAKSNNPSGCRIDGQVHTTQCKPFDNNHHGNAEGGDTTCLPYVRWGSGRL